MSSVSAIPERRDVARGRRGYGRTFACLLAALVLFQNTDAARAQPRATLTGGVIDAETLEPLTSAHVFIAGSRIGTITDGSGRYRLERVPPGAHTVYVSMLGYEPARLDTLIRTGGRYEFPFRLKPTVLEGPELVVEAERPGSWYRQLDRFERFFIGETPFARECTLENPEVLSFESTWWGRLRAEAREPLVLVNRALGYRLTYYLEEFEASGGTVRFTGETFFEDLESEDSLQAARWEENRRKAYFGSMRHFMRSLVEGTYRDEGFRVFRRYNRDGGLFRGDQFRFDRDRILSDGDSPEEIVLDFHGLIDIVYEREPAEPEFLEWLQGSRWNRSAPQQSLIRLTDGPARIDRNGSSVVPFSLTVYGYYAYKRAADMVPKDYYPGVTAAHGEALQ